MRKLLLILLCVPLLFSCGENEENEDTENNEEFQIIDKELQTYVPDDNFEQELIDLGYDNILDNYVTTDSIYSIDSLRLFDKNISDLTGIEDFILLTKLNCSYNPITDLNISKNINLTELVVMACPKLKSLDISKNISLTELHCLYNSLTNLDVSNNINLNILHCYGNQLTSLDVSNNTDLTSLACRDNQLTRLDVRNGNNMQMEFHCKNNLSLYCIDVDNAAWSTAYWTNLPSLEGGSIDIQSVFSEDCGAKQSDECVESYEESMELFPPDQCGICDYECKCDDKQ